MKFVSRLSFWVFRSLCIGVNYAKFISASLAGENFFEGRSAQGLDALDIVLAVSALGQYRWMRDLAGAKQADEAPFFPDTRLRCYGEPLDRHHVERVFDGLRKEMAWVNRGTHHAPRIHDLRHTFVVRRILLWQQQGVDVDQAMLALSTYVGHAKVTSTYWYLQAVPELMAIAAQRFEDHMSEVSDV